MGVSVIHKLLRGYFRGREQGRLQYLKRLFPVIPEITANKVVAK
jgi:sulfur relay (sulfurtransferase) DsrC/TusE family protein